MILTSCRVTANETVGPNIYVLSFHFPQIASKIEAGQFINIKVNELSFPLLRRPFSIYHVEGEEVKIIFDVRGIGTSLLSRKRPGDFLDILGPLGCAYNVDDDYDTALLVGGGLGIAPLPMVALAICRRDRNVITFLGARTRAHLIRSFLPNVRVATDDGSEGFHGTVVDLLGSTVKANPYDRAKIFACGPNPMIKSLSVLADEFDIPCEVSLESAMACGIGICQGCPVERVGSDKKYSLICKEGTVFDARSIRIA